MSILTDTRNIAEISADISEILNTTPSGSGSGKPNGRDSRGGRRQRPRNSGTCRPQIRWAGNVRFYQLCVRTSRTFRQRQSYDIFFGTKVKSSTWEA